MGIHKDHLPDNPAGNLIKRTMPLKNVIIKQEELSLNLPAWEPRETKPCNLSLNYRIHDLPGEQPHLFCRPI